MFRVKKCFLLNQYHCSSNPYTFRCYLFLRFWGFENKLIFLKLLSKEDLWHLGAGYTTFNFLSKKKLFFFSKKLDKKDKSTYLKKFIIGCLTSFLLSRYELAI